jgi:hypothetical protein
MGEPDTWINCPRCGAERPAEIAAMTDRPPCPECGEPGIAIRVGVAEEIDIAAEVELALQPNDQSRGWRQRWSEIRAQLDKIVAPRTEPLSGDAVKAAATELKSFYIQAYHLRDALKTETSAPVDDTITNDSTLALLADLANVVKHVRLDRPPRPAPEIMNIQGNQPGSGQGGWRLTMEISHKGKTIDGLDFAEKAVAAWERHLKRWGLI